MDRSSRVCRAQLTEIGQFARSDGVAMEARLLLQRIVRKVDGLAPKVHKR
jgi:hypothetical protein